METKLKHAVLTVVFAVMTLASMAQAPSSVEDKRGQAENTVHEF